MARRDNKSSHIFTKLLICIAALLVAMLYTRCQNNSNGSNDTGKISLDLAIPQFTKSTKSQVIEHVGYTVSYNEQRRNPNWVAYELTAEEVDGDEPRGDDFIPDPLAKGNTATTND